LAFFFVSSIFFQACNTHQSQRVRENLYLLFFLLEQGNPVGKQLHVLLRALARDPLVGQRAREGPVVVAWLLALVVVVVVVVWVAGILLHVLLALREQ